MNEDGINRLERDELADVKRQEMSSRFRSLFGPLPCLIGLHNWGPPKAVNAVSLHGQRDEDGEWEHWTEDPTKTVRQLCQSCTKVRDREDLDWELLADIQKGNTAIESTETEQNSNPL